MPDKKFPEPQACEAGDCPHIPLVPVTSNQVAAVGHCPVTNTLAVTFTRSPDYVYHYANCTAEFHQAFMAAESKGKHFGQHVKPLPFKKYRAPEKTAA